MSSSKHTTAIILVTYNGWALTRNCLKDLEPLLNGDNFVIAIADNGSSDGTIASILNCYPSEKFANIHIYPQERNLGFGAANNAAIRGLINDGIDFDAICLLNNDTRFDSKALIQLRSELDFIKTQSASHDDAVLSPTTFNVDGSRQNNFFAGLGPEGIGYLPFLLNAFRNETHAARILEGTPKATFIGIGDSRIELQEICWTSGVCWMLSRNLWEKSDGFDENIFMYYEDADLALRLRRLGAKFFITPRSAITHLGGGSSNGSLSRALQHDHSQQYVFKKLFGLRGLMLSKSFRFIRSLVRMLSALPHCLAGAHAKEKREYFSHHFVLLRESFK